MGDLGDRIRERTTCECPHCTAAIDSVALKATADALRMVADHSVVRVGTTDRFRMIDATDLRALAEELEG
jgi:hypothetical protein